jgi:DNA-binding MarR family transcriptional regulator
MNLSIVILRYLLQLRLFENRCALMKEVARRLSKLRLKVTSIERHIKSLAKQGLVEIRRNTVCAREFKNNSHYC